MNNLATTEALYKDFQKRFKLFVSKRPDLVVNTLSNIFTMRLIGNKTHGDLAEIGIAEFIHQFMYDFDSKHVGKDLFRAKEHKEAATRLMDAYKKRCKLLRQPYQRMDFIRTQPHACRTVQVST